MTSQPAPRFRLGQRKQLRLSEESLVTLSTLGEAKHLPLVVQPAVRGVSLSNWLVNQPDFIHEMVLPHGAVVFRGFGVELPDELQAAVTALCGEAMAYKERSSPRSQVAGNVYTSTDYPPDEEIFAHNEHSYSKTFPMKLFFCCQTPAASGGTTPLIDTRRVYKNIPEDVRSEF